jgi:hypothetical protein
MHFYLQLSMLLGAISMSSSIEASTFGNRGFDGRDGISGSQGRSGSSQHVLADGSVMNLHLHGANGGDGGRGEDGQDASGCFQPHNVPYNLQGADGGNGGRGGHGGQGGDGGNLTVQYSDLAHLRSIYINSQPGQGGYAGSGGQSGRPCYCQNYSWTITDSQGMTQYYHCTNGRYGFDGSAGVRGQSGSYGRVKLIGQIEPIEVDKPQLQVAMDSLENQQVYTLSKNMWEERAGAAALFAVGSRIASNYWFYLGRLTKLYSFVWNVDRPADDFSGHSATISLSSGEPKLSLPQNIWYNGAETQVDTHHTSFVFDQVLHQSEAFNLKIDRFEGRGRDLIAYVKDVSEVSDFINSKFFVWYYSQAAVIYYLRYSGEVSSELISQNGHEFAINLGRLNINSRFLQSGTPIDVRLQVTRSLNSRSAKKEITKKHTIR